MTFIRMFDQLVADRLGRGLTRHHRPPSTAAAVVAVVVFATAQTLFDAGPRGTLENGRDQHDVHM